MTQPKDNWLWAGIYGFFALILAGGLYDYKQYSRGQQEHIVVTHKQSSEGVHPSSHLTTGAIKKTDALFIHSQISYMDDGDRANWRSSLPASTYETLKSSFDEQGEIFASAKMQYMNDDDYKSWVLAQKQQGDDLLITNSVVSNQVFMVSTQLHYMQEPEHRAWLDSFEDQPKQKISSLEVCQNNVALLLQKTPVQFSFGKFGISRQSGRLASAIVDQLQKCSFAHIVVEGHTDTSGSEDYNQWLSTQRATKLVRFLVDRGIDKTKITGIGLGSSQPLVANDTRKNRALNRRVSIRLH